jgi:hypothetical protein
VIRNGSNCRAKQRRAIAISIGPNTPWHIIASETDHVRAFALHGDDIFLAVARDAPMRPIWLMRATVLPEGKAVDTINMPPSDSPICRIHKPTLQEWWVQRDILRLRRDDTAQLPSGDGISSEDRLGRVRGRFGVLLKN